MVEGQAKVPNAAFGIFLWFSLRKISFSLYVLKLILILFIIVTVEIFLMPLIHYFMEAILDLLF